MVNFEKDRQQDREGCVLTGDYSVCDSQNSTQVLDFDLKLGLQDESIKGCCEICTRIEDRSKLILSHSEKATMIQSNWSDIINNFSNRFIPRLPVAPNRIELDSEHDKLIERLLFYNKSKLENIVPNSRDNVLEILHPRQYSTKIEYLSKNNSNNTGILLLDELSNLLHKNEIILCQKYVLFDDNDYFKNIYEREIGSLVWAINGTVYHAEGNDFENEKRGDTVVTTTNIHSETVTTDYCGNINSYFNISYSTPELPLPLECTPLILVNDLPTLKEVIRDILDSMEMHYNTKNKSSPFVLSIDLEHHSTLTYRGFVSLIQMSTRNKDYIIDPFEIFHELYLLNELTTNPRILKIFHGSDFDIFWLQRDFSVYIVNMFDTGQAAKILNTPGGYSLKNLMQVYCSIDMDKTHQLSDWRERPLSNEKIKYARSDTHYLPYIYDILKNLLLLYSNLRHGFLPSVCDAMMKVENGQILAEGEALEKFNFSKVTKGQTIDHSNVFTLDTSLLDPSPILTALHNSRKISAKTYFVRPMDVWAKLYSIKSKFPRSSTNNLIDNALCLTICHFLIIWREGLARLLDLSPNYIIKDAMIVRICSKHPTNETELFELFNPVPINVKRHSETILNIINTVKNNIVSKNEDDLFEFVSIISHLFLNVSERSSKLNENREDSGWITRSTSALSSKRSFVDCKKVVCEDPVENKISTETQPGTDGPLVKNSQQQENYEQRDKNNKKVLIKKNPDTFTDNFANNLFGDDKNNNSDSNEIIISTKIIHDINDSLYRGTSSPLITAKSRSRLRIPEEDQALHKTNNHLTDSVGSSFDSKESKELRNVTNDTVTHDQESVIIENDQVRIIKKSLREEYEGEDDYLGTRKRRKNKSSKEKIESNTEDKEVSISIGNSEKQELLSSILEKVKSLPASFACEENIPDFIKKATQLSSPVKTKKFISSMKNKKWHKR